MNVTAPTAAELDGILWQPAGRVRALQDRLLRRTIELCYDGHPHYARLMRAAGLFMKRWPVMPARIRMFICLNLWGGIIIRRWGWRNS